jgi:hypothetical protein
MSLFSRWRTSQTKAYAIAKPVRSSIKLKQKQSLEKSVLNFRSQEVSRETARKTPKFVRYDICGVSEVRRLKRKTPQNKALSGVFVFAADSLQPVFWRARTYAITNALQFWRDAERMPATEHDPGIFIPRRSEKCGRGLDHRFGHLSRLRSRPPKQAYLMPGVAG